MSLTGRSNYVQARTHRMVVFNVSDLLFFLENGTYKPLIEASSSSKGQQLFLPYVYDLTTKKKSSIVKVYPMSAQWLETENFKGEKIYEFVPSTDEEKVFQSKWVSVMRIFAEEMNRIQANSILDRPVELYIMDQKDRIRIMPDGIKAKGPQFREGQDFRTSNLNMVYFLEKEGQLSTGVTLQESFPIDPHFSNKRKRTESSKPVEESKVEP